MDHTTKAETEGIILAINAERDKLPSELRRRIDNADTRQEALDEFHAYFNTVIESSTNAQMDVEWVENILSFVPEQLKQRDLESVKAIIQELQTEYEHSAKKAAVHHILRDSHQQDESENLKQATSVP